MRALRPVRRALSHRGVGHAEIRAAHSLRREAGRTPKSCVDRINDFALKLANVNGTGSASANGLLMQAIFRMGIPGLRQESVPLEHPGPAHLVRDPRQQGRLHRARARLRPDGRDELADLRARHPRGAPGRLPAVRFLLAARSGAAARRRHFPRRAASRSCATRTSAIRASAF